MTKLSHGRMASCVRTNSKIGDLWVRSPRWASYCSGSRPNVFLLLFTRLNVHTIVVHDSFCCSVVSVEQEQQKNGRTFRCSSGGSCCFRRFTASGCQKLFARMACARAEAAAREQPSFRFSIRSNVPGWDRVRAKVRDEAIEISGRD